ncbi:hypothetical protein HYDPIDRAFT_87899 [Hydnomerulius pinastri MD-312]|nr:hypothetical protein HYDPIDRAFT_87899 [Hydnomerulius pinastri MD-312]
MTALEVCIDALYHLCDCTRSQDFENTLKEVVNAKRLSASKMTKLTEIAMKSLQDDTKLVAILYRTHKSLANSAKVSSLYAFDALARAARSQVNKRGITGDINSAKGNAATFLLKIEGVLDGLFQDMTSLDNAEAKEKTKKVLDIWLKSNTFPSAVLTRLRDILSDVQKGAYQNLNMCPLSISSACVILAIFAGVFASNEMRVSTETQFGLLFPSENVVNRTPPIDPRVTTEAPVIIATPPSAAQSTPTSAPDVQSTLLALLGQAAQITGQSQPGSANR